jgi:kumamolisin
MVLILSGLWSPAALADRSQTGTETLPLGTPLVVLQNLASLLGHHNSADLLQIDVALKVHNASQLDAVIAAASTPGTPSYGRYLTPAQYLAQYGPTDQDVQTARSWLTSQELTVTNVSPNHLLVSVRGTTLGMERAFGVTINDYRFNNRTFRSNNRNPTVPSYVSVQSIIGLSTFDRAQSGAPQTNAVNAPGHFFPGDLQKAYDFPSGIDGTGQTIGMVLWGAPMQQSDFDAYASATGTPRLVMGQAGADGIDFIPVDGTDNVTVYWSEVALDAEVAHGVAPGSHIKYWLASGSDPYGLGTNDNVSLADAESAAVNDPSVQIISNSWGGDNTIEPFIEPTLQFAASIGKTVFFSSGDWGAEAQYPSLSPYVVAVGGTTLALNADGSYQGESGWSGSGGWCDSTITRPAWQVGVTAASCSGRAMPDVAADADPNTGVYVYYNGKDHQQFGGTSLAAPLWAAMSVVWDHALANAGQPGLGFTAPLLYHLANNATTYANDFHDVTQGSNYSFDTNVAYSAGTGWDEVTGWGSLELAHAITDTIGDVLSDQVRLSITGPNPASGTTGGKATLVAQLTDASSGTAISGKTITFSVGAESCSGTSGNDGVASCVVTLSDAIGAYTLTAAFAGDASYASTTASEPFTVNIATAVSYAGDISGTQGQPALMTATLQDADGNAVINEPITFSVGAESCTADTSSSGTASCFLTPFDAPGNYPISASFAGSTYYLPSSDTSHTFTLKDAPPTVSAGGPYAGVYETSLALDGSASDIGDDSLTIGWSATANSGTTGSCSFANVAVPTTNVSCTAIGSYTLTLSADDGVNPAVTSTATLTISAASTTTVAQLVTAQDVDTSVALQASILASPTVNEGTVVFSVTDVNNQPIGTPISIGVSNGIASTDFNPYGLAPGSYIITASYHDAANNFADSSSTSTLTIVPGPPTALALTPGTTTATLGSSVTEVASVTDALGYPVADGTTVSFSVSGNTTLSESVTTSNGDASFSYEEIFPGADTLTAGASGGNNPFETAQIVWVAPPSTPNAQVQVINPIDPFVDLTATTRSQGGTPSGFLLDWSPGVSLLDARPTGLIASNGAATIFGRGTLSDGTGVIWRVDATSNRFNGTIRLRMSNGYDSGTLQVLRVVVRS